MKADKSFFNELRAEVKKNFSSQIVSSSSPIEQEIEGLEIVKIIQDINSGKIRFNEIDWEKELNKQLKIFNIIPGHFPHILWLYGILNMLDDVCMRMNVIEKLQNAASKCFQKANEMREFCTDCDSLVKIYLRVREFGLNNDEKVITYWEGEQKCLNDLAHIFADGSLNGLELLSLANEIYYLQQHKKYLPLLATIMRSFQYDDELYITNIVDFAKNLYIAEGFRQLILSGKTDYDILPTLSTFTLTIRNKCFDWYIEKRVKQIEHDLGQDNTRVEPPTNLECYEHLLSLENQYVRQENALEDFRGSAAYNALCYSGREDVLNMMNIFIQYLSKYIAKKEAELSSQAVNSIQLPANANQVIIKANEVNIKDNKGTIISDSNVSVYPK